jgi:uncharacterized protein YqhQ
MLERVSFQAGLTSGWSVLGRLGERTHVEDVLDLMARADEAAALPRLGGMARVDGVVIVSERYWALARRNGDLHEGKMPAQDGWVCRLPLLRGLVRLGVAFAPLLRGSGVARPAERVLFGGALLAPVGLSLLPAGMQLVGGIALALALAAWLFRGRTLNLHGAEHRAIAAAERRQMTSTWDGETHPPRFSRRCGTNFAFLALALTAVLYAFVPLARDSFLSLPLSLGVLALTMEIWVMLQSSTTRAGIAFLLPGLAMQRVTTREPTLFETRLALRATASVLRRELG